MPIFPLLIAGGSIFAWESVFGGKDEGELLSWSNILKIAAVAGAAYFAAKALRSA